VRFVVCVVETQDRARDALLFLALERGQQRGEFVRGLLHLRYRVGQLLGFRLRGREFLLAGRGELRRAVLGVAQRAHQRHDLAELLGPAALRERVRGRFERVEGRELDFQLGGGEEGQRQREEGAREHVPALSG